MKLILFIVLSFSEVVFLSAKLASIRYPEFPFPPKICLKFQEKIFNLTEIMGEWYLQVASNDFLVAESECPKFHFEKSEQSTIKVELTFNQSKPLTMDLRYQKNILLGSKRLVVSPALFIDVPIEYQIVHIDNQYVLIYGCGNFHVYSSLELVDSFYLLKKDRLFNDFDEMYRILLMLKSYNANLNRANIFTNDGSCTN